MVSVTLAGDDFVESKNEDFDDGWTKDKERRQEEHSRDLEKLRL